MSGPRRSMTRHHRIAARHGRIIACRGSRSARHSSSPDAETAAHAPAGAGAAAVGARVLPGSGTRQL
jgi:hypothetical protein